MSIVPTILISNTAHGSANGPYNGSDTEWVTAKFKGIGYYNYTDGLHTASVKVTDLLGYIKFQATLATTPSESDWFDVANATLGDNTTPVTTSTFFNFEGNFVWIRVSVSEFTAGTINKVIYN